MGKVVLLLELEVPVLKALETTLCDFRLPNNDISVALILVSSVFSYLRGGRYVYEESSQVRRGRAALEPREYRKL
jgi:hypothetical protein